MAHTFKDSEARLQLMVDTLSLRLEEAHTRMREMRVAQRQWNERQHILQKQLADALRQNRALRDLVGLPPLDRGRKRIAEVAVWYKGTGRITLDGLEVLPAHHITNPIEIEGEDTPWPTLVVRIPANNLLIVQASTQLVGDPGGAIVRRGLSDVIRWLDDRGQDPDLGPLAPWERELLMGDDRANAARIEAGNW